MYDTLVTFYWFFFFVDFLGLDLQHAYAQHLKTINANKNKPNDKTAMTSNK